MLRHGGIANSKQFGKVANRPFSVDQLANDQQPVTVGERLEQLARAISRGFHNLWIYFHTCVST